MRRAFSLRTTAIALSLAIMISNGVSGPAQAESKSWWNPTGWLVAGPSDEAVKKAKEQAELARKEALKAAELARRAEEKAKEAQLAAEKAELKQRRSESPVARQENKPRVEAAPKTTASSTPNFTEESTEDSEKGGWNLMNLFKAGSEEKAETGKSTAEKKQVRAEEKKAPAAESKKAEPKAEEKSRKWFGKSEEKTASVTEPARKQEVAVTPDIHRQAAVIETEKGNIAIEFYPDDAPQTVQNFVKLVSNGFYNKFNMKFHRVIPGFVIQTGDPTGTGAGGSKETVPLEVKNKLSHNAKGVVAMARGADINSATSQFYITLAPQASLDAKYAIFGKVISGMDVLDKIEKGDMLYGIRMVDLSAVKPDAQPEKKGFFSSIF